MAVTSSTRPGRVLQAALTSLLFLTLLTACSQDERIDPEQVDAVEPPREGACRVLTPDDVAEPANATRMTDCGSRHTARTYDVGTLPQKLHDEAYDSRELGKFAYRQCSRGFQRLLGADESTSMRTVLSWAWFRPSESAWEEGARWYRCDVVGGGETFEEFLALPERVRGLLTQPADRWMVCARGTTVTEGTKLPCSEPHDWRAVTTIKVAEPQDPYPGDKVVQSRTENFCSDSVGAWMGYPLEYSYGYTWFHAGEWAAGNRRSVCWAQTSD